MTLAPSITAGDNGELAAVLATGGIAHPPGYPLYSAIGRIFSALPIGSGAWRTNLLSAVFGAACAWLLLRLIYKLTRNLAAACSAAGLFAFSALVWPYAVTTEVFSLNNFLILVFFTILLDAWGRIRERRLTPRICFLVFLCTGLGASHHTSFVLVAFPALAVLLIEAEKNDWGEACSKKTALLAATSGLFMGLSPILYLPWLARSQALISWGDPSSLKGLFTHLLRKEYGTFRLGGGEAVTGRHMAAYIRLMTWELLRQTLFLFPIGLWSLLRSSMNQKGDERKFLAWATGSGLCFYSAVFIALANLPLEHAFYVNTNMRFWQAPLLLSCLWIGIGLADLMQNLWKGAALAASAAIVAVQFFMWLPVSRQDRDWSMEVYGKTLIGGLPGGAILIVSGDGQTNAVRYVQGVEGCRPDVRIVNLEMLTFAWLKPRLLAHYPDLVFPGRRSGLASDEFSLAQFVAANIGRHPVFITVDPSKTDSTWGKRYSLLPFGLALEAFDRSKAIDWKKYQAQGEQAANAVFHTMLDPTGPDAYESMTRYPDIWEFYWHAPYGFALALMERPAIIGENVSSLKSADRVLAGLENILNENLDILHSKRGGPELLAAAHHNLGIVLVAQARLAEGLHHDDDARRRKIDRAIAEFKEGLRLEPNDPEDGSNLGSALISAGRYEAAIGVLREPIRKDWPPAHLNMGIALSARGRFDEALREFDEALRLQPDLAAVFPEIDYEMERRRARRDARLKLFEAYNAEGLDFARQGKMNDAAVQFRQALRLSPNYAEAHNNLGAVLAAQGALAEAISQYRSALRIDPNFLNADCNLALALVAAGNSREAKVYFDRALALSPNRAELLRRLTLALAKQGNAKSAELLRN